MLIKRIKNSKILFFCLKHIAYLLVKIIFSTYRVKIKYDPKIKDVEKHEGVFFTWHQDIIAGAAFMNRKNISINCVVSPSRDGKFVGFLAKKFGFKVIHGSAHKKPIALVRKAIRVLSEERRIFLIGDGSRGPAKKLQPGLKYLAKKSQLPLIFIECNTKWKITLHKSWDKFQIPLPFSKIEIRICLYK